MDYSLLRKEGMQLLEQLTGGEWTDFNAHDPGITLLEQLCYVLSDFAYRAGHPIPDLLAEHGRAPTASLHAPEAILPCQPVTLADVRRVVLDIPGVKNAWVEPLRSAAPACYFLPGQRQLQLHSTQLSAQPIYLRGLYHVLIEPSGDVESPRLRALAAERLHSCRSLGADLSEITVLQVQPVQVDVTLEVAPLDSPQALLAELRACLDEQLAPAARFASLSQCLAAGRSFEEIFEGPLPQRGWPLDSDEPRRNAVHTSDLLHALKNLPAIRAVPRLRIAKSGAWEEWSLAIDADRVPRLDAAGSKVTLRRGGQVILRSSLLSSTGTASSTGGARSSARSSEAGREAAPLPPAARSRQVGNYTSLQPQLPQLYGIGEAGLPDSASPERKAQANQLRAYLLLFDQLCQNQFSQLAHLDDLLAYDSAAQTYFTQALDAPGLGLEAVRPLDAGHRQRLQELVEAPGSEAALQRKQRLLNHLLARFAEPIADFGQAGSPSERAQKKQTLLRQYPELSSRRGTGSSLLRLDGQDGSGLLARLRLDLGLDEPSGEQLVLIEHIFLRPRREDLAHGSDGQLLVSDQPLIAEPVLPDPYSLQVSFVLPLAAGRFQKPEFRQFIEDQLRQRLPAHLIAYVHWLDAAEWTPFCAAHADFQRALRIYTARSYGIELTDLLPSAASLRAIDVRGARDRLIDLLKIGQTYPLADTEAVSQSKTVGYGMAPIFFIDPGQLGVRYQLCEQSGEPVAGISIDGTAGQLTLVGPNIVADHTYRLLAYKIAHPERQTLLFASLPIKIGLNTNLPVTLPALSPSAPLIDYGDVVEVRIGKTQAGARYCLLNAQDVEVSQASVMGQSGEISLYTKPLYEDTVLRVLAIRDTDLPEGQLAMRALLDTSRAVAVRANPALALSLAESAIVEYGGTPTLRIAGSQSSVAYRAYIYSLLDTDFVRQPSELSGLLAVEVPGAATVYVRAPACPFPFQPPSRPCQTAALPGTDGLLQLPLPALSEDSVVLVKAEKSHSAAPGLTSARQLQQSLAILARPSPQSALQLQLTVAADGTTGSLLVAGGQPGVFYYFRKSADATPLGLPAYFHKTDDSEASSELNRGLGQAWFETDLVVARDPTDASPDDLSRRRPPDPVVELSALPSDGQLHVLAVKARTAVAWSSGRLVTVSQS